MSSNSIVETMLSEVLKSDTVDNVAKMVGIDSDKVSDIIETAVPTLVKAMSKNAATEEGAKSLDKALDAHASEKKVDVKKAVVEADTKDGEGIVGHILGGNLMDTVSTMASSLNIDKDKIIKVVSMIAPLLLTFIASSKKKAKQKAETTDTTELLGSVLSTVLSSSAGSKKNSNNELIGTLLKAMIK